MFNSLGIKAHILGLRPLNDWSRNEGDTLSFTGIKLLLKGSISKSMKEYLCLCESYQSI